MKRSLGLILCGAVLVFWLAACKTPSEPETAPGSREVLSQAALRNSHGAIDFTTQVKPVLEAKCVVCHNRTTLAFFSLESRKLAFAVPTRIVPGHPEKSLLIVNGTLNHAKTMPPVGDRLTEDEKRILTAWVKQGAAWPAGPAGDLHPVPDTVVP